MKLSDDDIGWLITATKTLADVYRDMAPPSVMEKLEDLRQRLEQEFKARGY